MNLTRYQIKFNPNILTLFLIIAIIIAATPWPAAAKNHSSHDYFGSHGMVLVYDQQAGIFASHLPLYRAPHNYQIIYKVEVADQVKLMPLLAKGMVTVLPEKFDLKKLINKESFSIQAQFFQGHFERGGQVKTSGLLRFSSPVLIEKVVPEHSNSAIFYQVPVSNNKAIIAHKIGHVPSFDSLSFMPMTTKTQIKEKQLISCKSPKTLDLESINKQLAKCGIAKPVYVETRDFES